jgi:DDE superfamily endonuclease
VDEKPVVLHTEVRLPRPMRPGRILRRDSEYKRKGTANLFCGVWAKAGWHLTQATPNRSSPRFAEFLVDIASHYPQAKTLHLVLDNLSSHTRKATDPFGEQIGGWIWGRFTPHYTPKHGGWLNQAEIEIGLFSCQCLGHRRIPTLNDLRREAGAGNAKMNRHRVLIDWRFTRAKARQKFRYKRHRFTRSEYWTHLWQIVQLSFEEDTVPMPWVPLLIARRFPRPLVAVVSK